MKSNIKITNFDKEQWKYTNIAQFEKYQYNFSLSNKTDSLKNSNTIQVNNGKLITSIDNDDIIVNSIKNIIKKNLFDIKNKLNQLNSNNSNPFIKINSTNYNDGVFIHIKDNSIIKEPVVIKNIINNNKTKKFLNEKLLIIIGDNVSVKLIFEEKLHNNCNLNTVTQVYIGKNSIIDFIHTAEKPKATQIYNFTADVDSSSTLNLFLINITGHLVKKNYFINLNQANSSCNISSLNLLDSNNHIDDFININHISKHTTSSTIQKNILKGKSKCIFYAKAKIFDKSYSSQVSQTNNNIILSNNAIVHSNPQLEIHNNDVKCSHGSTTGELDADALFYMRSRGIDLSECKKLILNGFANSVIDNIMNDKIKNKIKNKIDNWLLHVN